jgi:hypothetical protein
MYYKRGTISLASVRMRARAHQENILDATELFNEKTDALCARAHVKFVHRKIPSFPLNTAREKMSSVLARVEPCEDALRHEFFSQS